MPRIIAKTVNTRVLVVDDNEVNLLIAKTTLDSYGITVSVAESGAAALRKFDDDTDPFDLIILDCIMPEMNGHETASRIRELKGPRLPIVAYTANDPDAVLAEFEDVGVSDVLIKPLDTIALTKVLLKYLPDEKFVEKDKVLAELKLLESDHTEQEEVKKTRLCELLERIPELDYATGLKYSAGNEENYLNVLRAALESIKSSAVTVATFSKHSNDAIRLDHADAKRFRVLFHSLKGICASIGIDSVSQASAEYEKQVKELADRALPAAEEVSATAGSADSSAAQAEVVAATAGNPDSSAAQAEFPDNSAGKVGENGAENLSDHVFLSGLCSYGERLFELGTQLFDVIRDYDEENDKNPENEATSMEPALFKALWARTLECVRLFDIDAVKDGLRQLHAASSGDTKMLLKKAIDAANSFDYKKVTSILTEGPSA